MTTNFEKLMDHLESISIWKPADVTQEPNTTLTQWRIYRVKGDFHGTGDTIHFVGYAGYEGRVCSAVQTFDVKSRKGVTGSGRVYLLSGDPGYNGDAMYVWGRWLAMNANPEVEDITLTYTGNENNIL
jgi:hypothetical protein